MTTKQNNGPPDLGPEIDLSDEARQLIYRGLAAVAKGEGAEIHHRLVDEVLDAGYRVLPDPERKTCRVFGIVANADAAKALNARLKRAAAGRKRPAVDEVHPVVPLARYEPGKGRMERRGALSEAQYARESREAARTEVNHVS